MTTTTRQRSRSNNAVPLSASRAALLIMFWLPVAAPFSTTAGSFALQRRVRAPAKLRRNQAWQVSRQSVVLPMTANGNDSSSGGTANGGASQMKTEADLMTALETNPHNLRLAADIVRQMPPASEQELSREAFTAVFGAIEECTANAPENDVNLRSPAHQPGSSRNSKTEFPVASQARQDMTDLYQALRARGHLRLFGAVSAQLDQLPAAGNTHAVPPTILEQITNLPMAALTPQPTNNSLLLAGVALAVAEVGISAGLQIPLQLLGFLTVFGAVVDRLFINGALLESFVKLWNPETNRRMAKHEAGHFLLAYLLGCPVEGVVLNAWQALQDSRFTARQVSAGTSFFDPELSQQINSGNSGIAAATSTLRVTRLAIDRYSMIVMAGIAAEARAYQGANGGAGDELALVAFLSQLNGGGAGATVWNNDSIRNQARWGVLQALLLLQEFQPAYDALVQYLDSGSNRLGDCVYALEKAARQHKLPATYDTPMGYLVKNPEMGTVSWTATDDLPESALSAAMALSSSSSLETPVSAAKTSKELQETLQDYRAQVEAKLQTIEEQLEQMQG